MFSLFADIENIEKWSLDNLKYSFGLGVLPTGDMKMVGGRICIIKNCSFAHLLFQDNQDFHSLFVVTGEESRFSMDPGRVYSMMVEEVELRIWQQQKTVYALTG